MLRTSCFRLRSIKYSNFKFISTSSPAFIDDKPNLDETTDKTKLTQPVDLKEFTPIYKFPFIRPLAILNRLKLYHTATTAISLPASLILNEFGIASEETLMVTIAVGISGCISLFSLGALTNKFIGFVYLNRQEDSVRVAYIDFWGKRKDIEIPLSDIVPFSELPVSPTDLLYIKFKRVSVTDTLKINFKYGQILNKDKYHKVFSEIYN